MRLSFFLSFFNGLLLSIELDPVSEEVVFSPPRDKTEASINKFLSATDQKSLTFPPYAKYARSIIHDVAEVH